MAVLNNNSSGNYTTASTWSVIDTASFSNSEAASSSTSTTFVSSANFTPGTITCDGIGIKIVSRSASPTGTFSVRLFNTTLSTAVAGTTVTVNVSDITQTSNGWYFFKFASSVGLLGATNYAVQVSTSTVSQVTVYRTATSGNWSRFLRTTTTAAPAAGDTCFVTGEMLSAGTNNSFTVTMNNTNTTNFGLHEISGKGTLEFGTSASTAYELDLAGSMFVNGAGVLNIGTTGTPMPATSSALLKFVVGSNVQYGLIARGDSTITTRGATKTGRAKLAANAAASATSLTTDVSTSWLNGDSVVVAATSRTVADTELVTLSANASGTTLTVSSLAVAHSGTTPTQAELANLTRNVKISGVSTSLQSYVATSTVGTATFAYTEFFFLGSAVANSRGFDVGTTTGSLTITGCAFRNFEVTGSRGLNYNTTSNANITVSDCVFYRTADSAVIIGTTSSTTNSIDSVWAFSNINSSTLISISAASGSFTNLVAVSSAAVGILISPSGNILFTCSGHTAHTCTTIGIQLSGNSISSTMNTISNLTTWNNITRGVFSNITNMVLDGLVSFGNASNGIEITLSAYAIYRNMTINAGVTITQPVGIAFASSNTNVMIDSCSIGTTTTHSTADINFTLTRQYQDITLRNTTLGSSTPVGGQSNLLPGAMLKIQRLNTTAGNHRSYQKYGLVTRDTVIFNQSTQSVRMAPNSALYKMQMQIHNLAIKSGQGAVVKCYVRTSVAGDGTAYNGNFPRLLLLGDPAAGISSTTVLATATSASSGAWELLTGTIPALTDNSAAQLWIDCDGTTGWVNFSDFRVS